MMISKGTKLSMGLKKNRKPRRACVIGLDGVPFGMVEELARAGSCRPWPGSMDLGKLHR